MVEREVLYPTGVSWKDILQKLSNGEIGLAITQLGERFIIEFTSNLDENLKEELENLERNTRVISGQNPSVIQIYTTEGAKEEVLKFIEKLQEEGI